MTDTSTFKRFVSCDEARAWGEMHFGNWLPNIRGRDCMPQTPAEEFFVYYARGANNYYNRVMRGNGIENTDFNGSYFSEDMFYDGISEIQNHRLSENIVVYRYISKVLISQMIGWGDSRVLKSGTVLVDKGFFSTTLCLEAVQDRDYATLNNPLFTIYVPKSTPCVYLDIFSDMNEQEMLFAPGIKLKVIKTNLPRTRIECIVI